MLERAPPFFHSLSYAPRHVPSLRPTLPFLHAVAGLLLGKLRPGRPWHASTVLLAWLGLSVAACVAVMSIGESGAGVAANTTIGAFFLIALPVALYNKHALMCTLLHFSASLAHPAGAAEVRASWVQAVLGAGLVCFPAIVLALGLYTAAVKGWWQEEDQRAVRIGFLTATALGAVLVTLGALQVAVLNLVSVLMVVRMRALHGLLQARDMAAVRLELLPSTPLRLRRVLSIAPPPEPLPTNAAPATAPAPAPAGWEEGAQQHHTALTSSSAVPHPGHPAEAGGDLHDFSLLYAAVRQETEAFAGAWSAPLALFLLGYAAIFLSFSINVLRSLIKGTDVDYPAIAYIVGFLAFVLLNMAPVITINGQWGALLRVTNWSRWSPQERMVLAQQFAEEPTAFPVLGLTLTWGKIVGLVVSALVPVVGARVYAFVAS